VTGGLSGEQRQGKKRGWKAVWQVMLDWTEDQDKAGGGKNRKRGNSLQTQRVAALMLSWRPQPDLNRC